MTSSRSQAARIVWWLVSDLLSLPFHLIKFVFTRAQCRRDFQRALKDAAP